MKCNLARSQGALGHLHSPLSILIKRITEVFASSSLSLPHTGQLIVIPGHVLLVEPRDGRSKLMLEDVGPICILWLLQESLVSSIVTLERLHGLPLDLAGLSGAHHVLDGVLS